MSESGAKLTIEITEKIETAMRSHPGPNQVYVILIGGNNMRKTTNLVLEVAKLVSRFRRIMTEAQKAKVRVLLCGTIPDPRPAIDSKLKLLDEALNDLEMGEGNRFLTLRGSMLDAQGHVRRDLYKPRGDIHLNASGTKIASFRIQKMLEIMLPALAQAPAPVQAPVPTPPAPVQATAVTKPQRVRVQAPVQDPAPVVNAPPVVNVQQVAAVVNAPAVVNQDQVETPMKVEDEDALLQRLFFKRFGRALPEKEKEKDDVDLNMDLIDLTEETDEMETDTMSVLVPIVKTEPVETADIVPKKLRKSIRIKEKEAPENVIATDDTDMAKANSVNPIESVNPIQTAEQIIAESNAAIEASREFVAEFGDTPLDEFDDIDIEPLC